MIARTFRPVDEVIGRASGLAEALVLVALVDRERGALAAALAAPAPADAVGAMRHRLARIASERALRVVAGELRRQRLDLEAAFDSWAGRTGLARVPSEGL